MVWLSFGMQTDLYITHLYPHEMSLYGDMGNIIAMKYRLKQRGYNVIYQTVGQNQPLPERTDWYFIGGGQDKEQEIIYNDLLKKKHTLIADIENGVSLLAICGGYQLLGKSFLTSNEIEVEGIGIFDAVTKAPDKSIKSRSIGNIIVSCSIPELHGVKLVGFENHGGQTSFIDVDSNNKSQYKTKRGCYPLGEVIVGYGNNTVDKVEGCVYKNAVGTYMHGSCLPKNPELADWFIKKMIAQAGLELNISEVNDDLEYQTKEFLIQRFKL